MRSHRAWAASCRFRPAKFSQSCRTLQESVAQHARHDLQRARLGERLVEVAALRRLHAGGAAALARAVSDEAMRVLDELLEDGESAAGDPHSAGVAVIDEDRRP